MQNTPESKKPVIKLSNLKDCFVPRNDGSGICLLLIPFLLYALTFSSCSFNPSLQGQGQGYLQGIWQQQPDVLQQKLVTFTSHKFTFSCDSFYLQLNTVSKVNYGADTCMNKGHWTEYVRGTYVQQHDTLFLKGQFCNPNYTIKETQDCLRAGNYQEYFRVSKKTDSLVQLSGTSSVIPLGLKLVKKLACTPKTI